MEGVRSAGSRGRGGHRRIVIIGGIEGRGGLAATRLLLHEEERGGGGGGGMAGRRRVVHVYGKARGGVDETLVLFFGVKENEQLT